MYDLEWPASEIDGFCGWPLWNSFIYCIVFLQPCQMPLKVLNETSNCLHTLYWWKFAAALRVFPETTWLSCWLLPEMLLMQKWFLCVIIMSSYIGNVNIDGLWWYAYQEELDKKVSEFLEELAIWEGYLSKVFADSGFLCFYIRNEHRLDTGWLHLLT